MIVQPERLAADFDVALDTVTPASREGARRVAARLREQSQADAALAILGEVDPALNPYASPPGVTHVALDSAAGEASRDLRYSGASELVRAWVGNAALDVVRQALQKA